MDHLHGIKHTKGNKNLPPSKERGFSLEPGWKAEPVNLLSNITFLLAAVVAAQFAESRIDEVLVYQVLCIAIFSSLSHLYVTRFTAIIDEIAICLFVVTYMQVFLFYMLGLDLWTGLALDLLFLLIGWVCIVKYRNAFNGAIDFVPVLLALWAGGFWVGYAHDSWTMLVNAFLATIAVVARIADFDVDIPVGTHFLWHIFTGWLLLNLLLTKFLIFPG